MDLADFTKRRLLTPHRLNEQRTEKGFTKQPKAERTVPARGTCTGMFHKLVGTAPGSPNTVLGLRFYGFSFYWFDLHIGFVGIRVRLRRVAGSAAYHHRVETDRASGFATAIAGQVEFASKSKLVWMPHRVESCRIHINVESAPHPVPGITSALSPNAQRKRIQLLS